MKKVKEVATFVEKKILEDTILIVLLHGMDGDGFPIFLFYATKANNMQKLNENTSFADLEKHGKIIHRGYGLPKKSDWDLMKEKYGLEQDKTKLLQIPKFTTAPKI